MTHAVKGGDTLDVVHDNLFEWDNNINLKNIAKHQVNFLEAATVFSDENAVYFDDDAGEVVDGEQQFIVLGYSKEQHQLMVCRCYRSETDRIKLISARAASKLEEKEYWRY